MYKGRGVPTHRCDILGQKGGQTLLLVLVHLRVVLVLVHGVAQVSLLVTSSAHPVLSSPTYTLYNQLINQSINQSIN